MESTSKSLMTHGKDGVLMVFDAPKDRKALELFQSSGSLKIMS